ncbi:hypothetical protein Cgig2_003476 [Carnegiea gigantea]|uniref:Uncharacterized protein n=1 Tax=Carnegiea gigantea TaxID=171969 RepID=A0A9Q1KC31_9CARY|nr:hypothetical protein Cgig2_003476 [Carnegiea gigantea]
MDRLRKLEQQSSMDSPTASPVSMSPLHRHARSSSGLANVRKPQNLAAKAAAQRLAQVMGQGGDDEEEDDDDLIVDYNPTGSLGGLGLAAGRSARPRSRSPKSVRSATAEQLASVRGRPSLSVKSNEQTSSRPSAAARSSPQPSTNSVEQVLPTTQASASKSETESAEPAEARSSVLTSRPSLSVRTGSQPRSSSAGRSSVSTAPTEQPSSARSLSAGRSPISVNVSDVNLSGRSPMSFHPSEQPRSASTARPSGIKPVPMVPSAVTISLKQQGPPSPGSNKRFSLDLGSMKVREPKEPNNQLSSTALQDELRLAEERFQEAEARAKQLEKQVASLGEGVSLEARLLSRQAPILFNKSFLCGPVLLYSSDSHLFTVQKRGSLAAKGGIYLDIAEAKHEYWSSLAPLPLEIVMAAGQKAKDDNLSVDNDLDQRNTSELSGDSNAESMLIVEKGLRELAVLKIEDAVRLAMAQQRRKNMQKESLAEDVRSPTQKYSEAYELSPEETEEVQFKQGQGFHPPDFIEICAGIAGIAQTPQSPLPFQAWLLYFWRRAKNHCLEEDIADDRVNFWINHSARATTSHDAVDVERGIMEMRKLGLEIQLWEETRRWINEQDSHAKRQTSF